MDEAHVRALVREAIARHHGVQPRDLVPSPGSSPGIMAISPLPAVPHVSASRFHIVRPATEIDCVIEPSVTCNHCGHCLCLGH